MVAFFKKILSFIMAVFAFIFPWVNIGNGNADYTLTLDANATTGYSWVCDVDDKTVIICTGNSYNPLANVEGLVGVGGKESFFFKAIAQGETTVTLTYCRNWQGGDVAETRVYTAKVDAEKKVTFTKNVN